MLSVIRAFPGLSGPERRKRKEGRKEREERGKRGMTGWHEYSTHRLCNCWRAYGAGWGWRLVGGRGSGNIRMCSLWKQQMENECMSPKVVVGGRDEGVDGAGRRKRVRGRFRAVFRWGVGERRTWRGNLEVSDMYSRECSILTQHGPLIECTHTHTHPQFNRKPFSAWGVLKSSTGGKKRKRLSLCLCTRVCVYPGFHVFLFLLPQKSSAFCPVISADR